MNKFFYLSFLLLFLILSCTVVKNKPAHHTTLSHLEFSNKIESRKINYSYLTMKSKAEININGQALTTPLQIRLKKDSIIWISMTPFLGIEVLRILIRTDSVFIINKMEKKNYRMGIDSVRKILTIPVTLKYIQELILGDLPVNKTKYNEISQDSSGFYMNFQEGKIMGKGIVSINNFRLVQFNLYKKNTSDSLNISYFDFKEWEETDLAYKSLYNINNKKFSGKLALEHFKIESKNSEITFPFTFPKENLE